MIGSVLTAVASHRLGEALPGRLAAPPSVAGLVHPVFARPGTRIAVALSVPAMVLASGLAVSRLVAEGAAVGR